jgi:hypothetical protein
VSPLALFWTWTAFACIFGGTLLGMFLRKILPEDHLSADAKEVVKMATGLIVLVTALVLGLFVASAKNTFDAQNTQVRQITANIILLDVVLAQYGPDADTARNLLRRATGTLADRIWRVRGFEHAENAPFQISGPTDAFYDVLWQLSPSTEPQRAHKARAIQITSDVMQTRLLLFTARADSIPTAFLVVLIFWLTIIFASFGLFAQTGEALASVANVGSGGATTGIFPARPRGLGRAGHRLAASGNDWSQCRPSGSSDRCPQRHSSRTV